MKASDVMTRRVISVTPDASIVDAIRPMTANHISGLPVIDKAGNIVGIITESDIFRLVVQEWGNQKQTKDEFLAPAAEL